MKSDWNCIYEKGYCMNYPNENLVAYIYRNYSKEERLGKKALDIGCGAGANTWMLAHEGFDTYGIDLSERGLELNRKRLESMELQATLYQGDFSELPYENAFFDQIIDDGNSGLNTIDNIKKTFREFYRVLKTGGKYYGRLLSPDNTIDFKKEIEHHTYEENGGSFMGHIPLLHVFTQQELVDLLTETGYLHFTIDYLVVSRNNQKDHVKEWLISAEK